MIQIKLIKTIFLSLFILYTGCLLALLQQDSFTGNRLTKCVYIVNPERIKRMNGSSTIVVSENYLTVIKSQIDTVMVKELLNETLTQRSKKFKEK